MDGQHKSRRKKTSSNFQPSQGIKRSKFTVLSFTYEVSNILLFSSQYTSVKEVIDGVPPFFREKPRDLALSEGEPLELTALVAADPKASVQWLKNDLIFMDDSRLNISTDADGRSVLVLDPAMPSDAGLYKVRFCLR